MKQALLSYGLPKETAIAMMMLYENTKEMVRSPDGGSDFFNIVAGILLGDTLTPYLFICLDYVLRTSIDLIKENGFTLKKQEADDILQKL